MNTLRQLQGVVLKAILFIVWFDLACFVLILVGAVFNWSFLNGRIFAVFLTVFLFSLAMLVSLVLLHVVLTLNSSQPNYEEWKQSKPCSFKVFF